MRASPQPPLGEPGNLPRLLMRADQGGDPSRSPRSGPAVLERRDDLDQRLEAVMEGCRLTRLPRIDRDILRLLLSTSTAFARQRRWPAQ